MKKDEIDAHHDAEKQARVRRRKADAKWYVIRVRPALTLSMAAELKTLNILGWTPKVWVRKRLPRKKARRLVLIPLLPGYIFIHPDAMPEFRKVNPTLFWYASPYLFNGWEMQVPQSELHVLAESDNPEKPVRPEEAKTDDEIVLAAYEVGEKVMVDHPLVGRVPGAVTAVRGSEYRVLLENFSSIPVRLPHFLLSKLPS